MLNPLLFDNFILYNEQTNVKILVEHENYVSLVQSGWRNSKTAKHSILLKNKKTNEKYYCVSKYTCDGNHLLDNPYYPHFFKNFHNNFLIEETGTTFDLNGGMLPYFWSRYIESPSLLEFKMDDVRINKFLGLYIAKNKTTSSLSSNCIKSYNILLHSKTKNQRIIDFINYFHQNIFKGKTHEFYTSWSHGDLWLKDVFFIDNDQFLIIDWEWFCESAPLGGDVLDFLFWGNETTAISFFEDFRRLKGCFHKTIFFANHFPEVMSKISNRSLLLAFFIYRYITRILIQEGYSVIDNDYYKKLIKYSFTLV